MAGRLTDAGIALADFLVEALDLADPEKVQRAYVPVLQRHTWTGWRFWILDGGLRDQVRLARGRVMKEIRLTVEAEVRCELPARPDEEGRVPVEWCDGQKDYVEAEIFEAINNKGVQTGDLLAGRFRMQECNWVVPYDPVRLDTEKVFASFIEVTLIEPAGG